MYNKPESYQYKIEEPNLVSVYVFCFFKFWQCFIVIKFMLKLGHKTPGSPLIEVLFHSFCPSDTKNLTCKKYSTFLWREVTNHWHNRWILPVDVTSAYVFLLFWQRSLLDRHITGKQGWRGWAVQAFWAFKDQTTAQDTGKV